MGEVIEASICVHMDQGQDAGLSGVATGHLPQLEMQPGAGCADES
jgi:hypothetical protein